MILHGNMMAAARALLLVPRPTTTGLMIHCPEGPGPVPLTLVLGDPLGGGAVLDLATPCAVFHLHGASRTELGPQLLPALLHGAGNAARGWQGRVDLAAPGLHTIVAVSQPGPEAEGRCRVQHFAKLVVPQGSAPPEAPAVLGLAAEIVPDLLPAGLLPGAAFSARVLAFGRPVAGLTVQLERMAAEPVGGAVMPLPGAAQPVWILAETDPAGRFRVSLPAPGLWRITAVGVGRGGWPGWRRLRHDAALWLRIGSGADPSPAREKAAHEGPRQAVASRRVAREMPA